jgi:hypothetical protein
MGSTTILPVADTGNTSNLPNSNRRLRERLKREKDSMGVGGGTNS